MTKAQKLKWLRENYARYEGEANPSMEKRLVTDVIFYFIALDLEAPLYIVQRGMAEAYIAEWLNA